MSDDVRDLPALGLLGDLDVAGPAAMIPLLLDRLGGAIGAIGVRLLVIDLDETRLEDRDVLTAGVGMAEGSATLGGTPQGDVYRTGRTQAVSGGDGSTTIITPVTARQVREGVLEVVVKRTETTERELEITRSAGVLLGYAVTAADRWTDEFHVTRRRKEMLLPAEMQWSQLPLAAFATRDVSLAGALEPAYEVGGDAFDYAYDADRLSAAVFDAMGHGLTAARLSAFGVAAYRNARRRGDDIGAQAATIHQALRPMFEDEGFMTAVMVQIDLEDPRQSFVLRAGHPAPILQHADAAPNVLDIEGNVPFGMPYDDPPHVMPLTLEVGDRLVLFSDGIVEARPEGGAAFGLDALLDRLVEVRELSPREATRRVTRAVRIHRSGDLADDATILMIDILDRS